MSRKQKNVAAATNRCNVSDIEWLRGEFDMTAPKTGTRAYTHTNVNSAAIHSRKNRTVFIHFLASHRSVPIVHSLHDWLTYDCAMLGQDRKMVVSWIDFRRRRIVMRHWAHLWQQQHNNDRKIVQSNRLWKFWFLSIFDHAWVVNTKEKTNPNETRCTLKNKNAESEWPIITTSWAPSATSAVERCSKRKSSKPERHSKVAKLMNRGWTTVHLRSRHNAVAWGG